MATNDKLKNLETRIPKNSHKELGKIYFEWKKLIDQALTIRKQINITSNPEPSEIDGFRWFQFLNFDFYLGSGIDKEYTGNDPLPDDWKIHFDKWHSIVMRALEIRLKADEYFGKQHPFSVKKPEGIDMIQWRRFVYYKISYEENEVHNKNLKL